MALDVVYLYLAFVWACLRTGTPFRSIAIIWAHDFSCGTLPGKYHVKRIMAATVIRQALNLPLVVVVANLAQVILAGFPALTPRM